MLRVLLCLVLLVLPGAALGKAGAPAAPTTLAGIALGQPVEELAGKVDMSVAMTLWRQEHLRRVALLPLPGFTGGSLDLGACREQGRVLRMKLKYADDSPELFGRLLKELEKRYGRGQWRGDAFGTLKSWKWSLAAANGDSVSLILQTYTGEDEDETPGTSIRLANRTAMERERQCADARRQAPPDGKAPATKPVQGLDDLLPR